MEKTYKTMGSVGAFNVVLGILMICFGIGFGTAIIAKGAKLLGDRTDLTF